MHHIVSSGKFKQTKIRQVKKRNEKLQKKLLYSFKITFQIGNKKFRVIYTLTNLIVEW